MTSREHLRDKIRALVTEYYRQAHAGLPFVPGETRVHYAGRVFDEQELVQAVESVLDFWLTAGPRATDFEERLAHTLGVSHALTVNSGSSANLIAVTALRSPRFERCGSWSAGKPA